MDFYSIRVMHQEDLPQVLQIEKKSFSSGWSEDMFLRELKSPDSLLFVAETGGRIVGYIVARVLGGGYSEIRDLAVEPSVRRRGIATALLNNAIKALYYRGATKVFLEVRSSNKPAQALYQKLGFIATGIRRNYYNAPQEDAILMEKTLNLEVF